MSFMDGPLVEHPDYYAYLGLGKFSPFLAEYIMKLIPYSNANLTLLDLWSYSFGTSIFDGDKPNFYKYIDLNAIESLADCTKVRYIWLAIKQQLYGKSCNHISGFEKIACLILIS